MGAMQRAVVPRVVVHGDVLRALMAKHGMSSAGLGMRAGLSPACIRMLCSGQRAQTKTVTAQRIADALGEPLRTFASPLPVLSATPRTGGTRIEESA